MKCYCKPCNRERSRGSFCGPCADCALIVCDRCARNTERSMQSQLDPASTTAARFDSGKPELDYCDAFPAAMEGVARVSMSGRAKYALFNFKKGAKSSRESYNCARRHMLRWYNGQEYVEDSAPGIQVHELDAAIWNLMRLRQELVDFPERDNRPHLVLTHPERALLDAPAATKPNK